MQVEDDTVGAARVTVPLYVALSIGAGFLATLGVVGFVTFQHVESSAPYVVAVHAGSRPSLFARAAAPGVASPPRAPEHAALRAGRAPKVPVAAPSAAATPVAESSAQPAGLVAAAHHASAPRRNDVRLSAETSSAAGTAPARVGPPGGAAPATVSAGAAAPVILTATSMASVAPALPAATAAPAEAASPAAEPTAAVVAAAVDPASEAPVYAPQRVVEARVKLAAEPEFPSDPSVAGLRGTSAVLVTIGPRGAVVKVALDQSSGHAAFDQAALNAARRSLYVAPQIDGKPATASYRMVYEFSQ